MKKFRIKITVDTGQEIFSKPFADDQRDALNEFLSNVSKMSYVKFDTSNGAVFLPEGMIQRSVFEIEELDAE